MTIKKQLARSNIAMLAIPLITAAVLAGLAACGALVLLRGDLTNLYLTRRIFRHISRPLDILTAGVARIRDGDLNAPIAYTQPDEFRGGDGRPGPGRKRAGGRPADRVHAAHCKRRWDTAPAPADIFLCGHQLFASHLPLPIKKQETQKWQRR